MLGSIIFGAGRACGAPFYYIPVPSCLWEWRGGGSGGGLLLEGCEGCVRACGAALRLLRGQGSESCVSDVFVVCVWCVCCVMGSGMSGAAVLCGCGREVTLA